MLGFNKVAESWMGVRLVLKGGVSFRSWAIY